MQKLRKAFDDDARQPRIIETLSKKGYRLVAPVSSPDISLTKGQSFESIASATRHRNLWIWASASTVLVLLLAAVAALLRLDPWKIPAETVGQETTPYSIAVLPFDNLNGDPAQEYFTDGMTDDLITKLARNPNLLVIARDSSFFYKGRSIDIRDVARKLKVRYILHGSIRRAGEQIWFNAQLVDATTGSHLWADQYDGQLSDVFELQDNVIGNILSTLSIRSDTEDSSGAGRQEMGSPEAYDYFLHGRNRFFLYANKKDNRKARELYEIAIELDPDFARAYAMLAWTYAFEAMNGWSEVREISSRMPTHWQPKRL